MRRSSTLLALCFGVLVGCSQHATALPLPVVPQSGMRSLRPDIGFKALYSFQAIPDGSGSFGRLLVSGGTFYANTLKGGAHGFGTVYTVSTAGKENVLYSFAGPPGDGSYPIAGLAVKSGEFYGTTGNGGANDYGTIFKISASGAEHVLYSFKNAPDGQNPEGGLVMQNGTFYGTTQFGGQYGIGTVFKVSASGAEKVIYTFNVNQSPLDGVNPVGDLIVVNGTLYGTTLNGGSSNHGTVFKVTPSGTEHVIHTFKGKPDGSTPYAGLIEVNGTLYGTTQYGGSSDRGTVFKMSTSGVEHVIYSFKGSPDGMVPYGRLASVNGTLYGTTQYGGASGNGAIFKVSTAGAEQVLHSFAGPPADGMYPVAGMTGVSGTLYGTTSQGGTNGNGIVFKLSP
jgi:uncharacterized repeat protein (TIGR03803 family)